MRRPLLLSLTLLLASCVLAQPANDASITWGNGRKLTWNDFQGTPDPASPAAASTSTFLGIEYSVLNGQFGYKITCRFSKNDSWAVHKTDYILAHEQGHFDIAEIMARRLNERMSKFVFNRKTADRDLDKIYRQVMADKESLQDRYDRETNHSIRKVEQLAWEQKIKDMLKETDAFKNY